MTLSAPTPLCSTLVRVLAAMLVIVLPVVAQAQTAPAGNAHPPTQALTDTGELPNPFGDHGTDLSKVVSPEVKAQLASGVDLEPLRGLAVFHNGRVKVLDTLAREMVSQIAMRKRYTEEGPDGKKVSYDPLFTLLDLVIDPAYYYDKPLLGIDYLPLRRAFVEAAERDEKAQNRLLR
jgi:hypothetical protein